MSNRTIVILIYFFSGVLRIASFAILLSLYLIYAWGAYGIPVFLNLIYVFQFFAIIFFSISFNSVIFSNAGFWVGVVAFLFSCMSVVWAVFSWGVQIDLLTGIEAGKVLLFLAWIGLVRIHALYVISKVKTPA
jgi:hypothetical protein